VSTVLIDAGPLVALLHASDQDHARCAQALETVRGQLATTWPPLTEAMHLLSFSRRAQDGLLALVERGALQVLDIGANDVPEIRSLMREYASLPMDFVDATLVRVAEREGIRRVFTLDRRDFSAYRMGRGHALTILP
jgi:predicted nucleic acid-binding protein